MELKFISKEIEGVKESNLEKLKQLFPGVFKDGQVDIEELKNQLGIFDEVGQEKYEFNWVGKQEAKQNAISNIKGVTLKYYPEESKDADTTENLYIEGDNLKVLKLLRNNYANKIKMIYIDPPYNTGNDTFVYPDSFKKTDEQSKEDVGITKDGERTINILKDSMYKNTKDSNKYHSAWLSMMYPRIKVAQELLSEDGIIFISIDDNEQENLKKMCNEIFGENNFIALFNWMKTATPPSLSKSVRKKFEYILCYAKTGEYKPLNGGTVEGGDMPLLNEINKFSKVYFPKESLKLKIKDGTYAKGEYDRVVIEEDFIVKDGIALNDLIISGNFKWTQETIIEEARNNTKFWIKTEKFAVRYEREGERIKKPSNIISKDECNVLTNEEAQKEIKDLFGKKIMDYPKPTSLLEYLINTCVEKNDIILDFFSGSATTADACFRLNLEDNKNRKFIMVQLPEICDENSEAYKAGYNNICEIGKERIRRAGAKIKEETNANIDYGFKVFKLDETNINWEKEEYKKNIDDYILRNGFIDEKQKEELMKDFADGAKDIDIVYEILLRYYGMPLSAKIDKLNNIGDRIYSIGDVVIVCLEDMITNEIIDKLSKIDFAKLYLRDSSFKGEKSLELKQNLMTRLNLQKDYKDEKAYKVEFV